MTEQTTAVSLMRMALALLDRNGMITAACYLEQAIHLVSAPGCVDAEALAQDREPGYISAQVVTQKPQVAD